jgi:alkylhydroperoxidase family enzyme
VAARDAAAPGISEELAMARMKIVRRPEDCGGSPQDVEELFGLLFPEGTERVFRGGQLGWGVLAGQTPRIAITVAQLTRMIARGPFLASRPDLRELAIQTVNMHFRCEFSYRSHLAYLSKVGLSIEAVAALPYWRTSTLFNAEQRQVIAYSLALVSGDVPDSLHDEVVTMFGQQSVGELALAVAHWSFWALLLNAAQLEIDPDEATTA